MPLSLIMGMVGISAAGLSLNTITLMSMTVSIGLLVTNSIVVIENIVRHRNDGKNIRKAAEEGTNEIFIPVLASTLTNLAVFIPIATTSGIIGSAFKALGLTIVSVTIASIFLSFTLTPLLASRMLKQKDNGKPTARSLNFVDHLLSGLDSRYRKLLNRLLSNKVAQFSVVISIILVFWATLQFLTPKLGSEFVPKIDEGIISISIELPPGTPIEITKKRILAVEEQMKTLPDLISISSSIGGSGLNTGVQYGEVRLQFTPETQRDESVYEKSIKFVQCFQIYPMLKSVCPLLEVCR